MARRAGSARRCRFLSYSITHFAPQGRAAVQRTAAPCGRELIISHMPRTRKNEAPIVVDGPVASIRHGDLGAYTVAFATFSTDVDPAPLFEGLPGNRCQCPHWGVVVVGELVVRYTDHVETFRGGDAYYIEPGHLPYPQAGTEVVEFSPTEELRLTMEVTRAKTARAGEMVRRRRTRRHRFHQFGGPLDTVGPRTPSSATCRSTRCFGRLAVGRGWPGCSFASSLRAPSYGSRSHAGQPE